MAEIKSRRIFLDKTRLRDAANFVRNSILAYSSWKEFDDIRPITGREMWLYEDDGYGDRSGKLPSDISTVSLRDNVNYGLFVGSYDGVRGYHGYGYYVYADFLHVRIYDSRLLAMGMDRPISHITEVVIQERNNRTLMDRIIDGLGKGDV